MRARASAAVRMPSRSVSTRVAGSSSHSCWTRATRTGDVSGSLTRARDSGTPLAWMSFTAAVCQRERARDTVSAVPRALWGGVRWGSVRREVADEPAVAGLAHRGDDAVLVDGGGRLRLRGGGLVDEGHDTDRRALAAVAGRVHDARLVDLGLHRRRVLDRHRLDV